MILAILSLLHAEEVPAPAPEAPAPEAPAAEAPAAEPAVVQRVPPPKNSFVLAGQTFQTSGELRWIANMPPAQLPVGISGETLGQSFVVDQRIRLGLLTRTSTSVWTAEADLFTGQIIGDTWDIAGSEDQRHRERLGIATADSFKARKLSLDLKTDVGTFSMGLQTSHWGLGMIANDGAHDPVFGRNDFGDRVLRMRYNTRLVERLVVVAAADLVVEDDTAALAESQFAWQLVGAMVWAEPEALRVGIYGVYRDQLEADQRRRTRVAVLDGYMESPFRIGRFPASAGVEVALISGGTDRSSSYNARDGLAVLSQGALGYVSLSDPKERYGLKLRAGYASGDGNPDDGMSRDFSFDRDLDVGMVLFDEVGGALEAGAYAELTDPENTGHPPDGVEATVTEGAFRRASFLQPVVNLHPLKFLDLRVGYLAAWASAPIAQPYATYRNGGVPTNVAGKATSGYWLGSEVDVRATLGNVPVRMGPTSFLPALILDFGYAMPSADLGVGRSAILGRAAAQIRW
ncbi:MAG TPA: hypothetical protein PLA94_04215 [Myxococcota bacterium]|nr:hypothetical protein [Myxococcota bacterium]